jgi:hypothetical protein
MSSALPPCLIGALLLVAGPSRADPARPPPRETLERLGEVTKVFDERGFQGSYRVDVASGSGSPDDPPQRHEVFRARKSGLGPTDRDLVRSTENGEDITEKRRAEIEKERDRRAADGGERPFEDLHLPTWENREMYLWEPSPDRDGLCIAEFRRRLGSEDAEGTGHGRLGWHCESLDPVWLELRPYDLPALVNELDLGWRFGRHDDFLLTQRFEFRGFGGLPFFKRAFSVAIEVSEFRLVPHVAAGSGKANPPDPPAGEAEDAPSSPDEAR